MKKWLSMILCALMVLSVCAAPAMADEKVELNFWYWDTNMDAAYTEMFEAFTAENPNIAVKMTLLPWADYWTKLATALPTGAGPDIFWLNHPNAVTYMPSGLMADIQGAVDAGEIDMSHFANSLYDPYTWDGTLYCVPIFFDTIAIAYNKQMLADAGYPDGPKADWTWDDLTEMATALTKDDVKGFGSTSDPQSGTMDFILQNGGDVFSEDRMSCILTEDKNVEAVQFLRDMMTSGISPTMNEYVDVPMLDMFQNDMLAMMPFGLWNVAPTFEIMGDNLGIAPMPQKAQKGTIVHNLGYAMSSKTANPEAAMTLMKYFSTKDHGDRIAAVFAPAYDESQQIWFEAFPTLDLTEFTDGLAYAKGLMISGKNAGQVYSLYSTEMQKLFENPETDTKEGLQVVQDLINAEIAK